MIVIENNNLKICPQFATLFCVFIPFFGYGLWLAFLVKFAEFCGNS